MAFLFQSQEGAVDVDPLGLRGADMSDFCRTIISARVGRDRWPGRLWMTLVALLVFSSVGASPTAAQVNTCTQWAYNPPGPIVMPVNSPTSQALYLLVSGGPSQFTTINSVSLVSNTSPPPLPSAKVVAIQQPGTGSGGAIVSFDSSGVPPGC